MIKLLSILLLFSSTLWAKESNTQFLPRFGYNSNSFLGHSIQLGASYTGECNAVDDCPPWSAVSLLSSLNTNGADLGIYYGHGLGLAEYMVGVTYGKSFGNENKYVGLGTRIRMALFILHPQITIENGKEKGWRFSLGVGF